jgi:hypothetical protein
LFLWINEIRKDSSFGLFSVFVCSLGVGVSVSWIDGRSEAMINFIQDPLGLDGAKRQWNFFSHSASNVRFAHIFSQ